jgi:hypothetical protein
LLGKLGTLGHVNILPVAIDKRAHVDILSGK